MINASVQTVSAERHSDWRIRASAANVGRIQHVLVTLTDSHAVQAVLRQIVWSRFEKK